MICLQFIHTQQRQAMNNVFDTRRVWGPKPGYPNVVSVPYTQRHDLITIAGPCSVESLEQMEEVAKELKECNVTYLRGGIYRAGTYPRPGRDTIWFDDESFEAAKVVRKKYNLKLIIEILDIRDIKTLAPMVDALQVGARHMQDYMLLRELSQLDKPVTLKRNMGATLDEFLGAAEYLARGRCQPILIERGSSTYLNHVRWDLSISMIAAIKRLTHLPIIVDASHGTGRRDLVEPMTYAGIAAGADGFLCEVHPEPNKSISDSDQAYNLRDYKHLKHKAEQIREIVNGSEVLENVGG